MAVGCKTDPGPGLARVRLYLPASCATPAAEGMVIHTNSMKVRMARKHIVELLLSEHNADCTKCYKNGNCELQTLASQMLTGDHLFLDLVPDKKYTPVTQ